MFIFLFETYFLQLIALKWVGAQSTGAIWREIGLHVNGVGSFMLQGDHIEALPHQVVSWHKGSGIALAGVPSLTAQNRIWQDQQGTQVKKG